MFARAGVTCFLWRSRSQTWSPKGVSAFISRMGDHRVPCEQGKCITQMNYFVPSRQHRRPEWQVSTMCTARIRLYASNRRKNDRERKRGKTNVRQRERAGSTPHLRRTLEREKVGGRRRTHRGGRHQLRHWSRAHAVRPGRDEGYGSDGGGVLPEEPPRGRRGHRGGRQGRIALYALRHPRGAVPGDPAHGTEDRGKRDPHLPPGGRQGRGAQGRPRRSGRDAPARRDSRRRSRAGLCIPRRDDQSPQVNPPHEQEVDLQKGTLMDTTHIDSKELSIRSVHIMADGTMEDFEAVVHPEARNREAVDEPPATRGRGPAAFYATALWLRDAYADLRWEIHDVVAEGNLVVMHATMSGRHTGTFVGYNADGRPAQAFPPTGKRFATTQTHWFRVADGKVIEHWANRDDLGTATQLGWAPPSPLYMIKMFLATRRARREGRR